jgi:branched-chain amino acid transport system substrate-binding protein
MSPQSPLNDWWFQGYQKAHNRTWPSQAPYRMVLGNGHQAIQPIAIGRTKWDAAKKKMVTLDDIQRFPAECVNPQPNMTSDDWLNKVMEDAKC